MKADKIKKIITSAAVIFIVITVAGGVTLPATIAYTYPAWLLGIGIIGGMLSAVILANIEKKTI